MFHDVVVNLIVVLIIVAMAVVWHATAGPINAAHPERPERLPRRALRAAGEPGGAVDRAAAGVVLPVPVRAPAHLQDARRADPGHHHHPDDLDGAAGGVALPRPGPRPAPVAAAVGRRHRPDRPGRPDRAHHRGRDRPGGGQRVGCHNGPGRSTRCPVRRTSRRRVYGLPHVRNSRGQHRRRPDARLAEVRHKSKGDPGVAGRRREQGHRDHARLHVVWGRRRSPRSRRSSRRSRPARSYPFRSRLSLCR